MRAGLVVLLEALGPDSWCTPRRVLAGHTADEAPGLTLNHCPARLPARLSLPAEPEVLAVPLDERLRLHDEQAGNGIGRIRLKQIPDAPAESLVPAIREAVELGWCVA